MISSSLEQLGRVNRSVSPLATLSILLVSSDHSSRPDSISQPGAAPEVKLPPTQHLATLIPFLISTDRLRRERGTISASLSRIRLSRNSFTSLCRASAKEIARNLLLFDRVTIASHEAGSKAHAQRAARKLLVNAQTSAK